MFAMLLAWFLDDVNFSKRTAAWTNKTAAVPAAPKKSVTKEGTKKIGKNRFVLCSYYRKHIRTRACTRTRILKTTKHNQLIFAAQSDRFRKMQLWFRSSLPKRATKVVLKRKPWRMMPRRKWGSKRFPRCAWLTGATGTTTKTHGSASVTHETKHQILTWWLQDSWASHECLPCRYHRLPIVFAR